MADISHGTVYSHEGIFCGWPANNGIWSWDDEILVGFTSAMHENKETGHPYSRANARRKFARSRDGGATWSIEDAEEKGVTGRGWDHNPSEDRRVAPSVFDGCINFREPGFALTFERMNNAAGPSDFYFTYDRGGRWLGPYVFPDMDTEGVAARTEYLTGDDFSLSAFVTTAKSNGREGRTACFRTCDGAVTWERVSWIGAEPEGERDFQIMPAAVRLSRRKILAIARKKQNAGTKDCFGLKVYLSDDNALTWNSIEAPELGNLPGQRASPIDNPPALIRLKDGRLCLAYGIREEPSRICLRLSRDEGLNWDGEIEVRGGDGANWDIGYPRMVQREDGKVILVYYYNHALESKPLRYIAVSVIGLDGPDGTMQD